MTEDYSSGFICCKIIAIIHYFPVSSNFMLRSHIYYNLSSIKIILQTFHLSDMDQVPAVLLIHNTNE